jgi:hypothetical protein
MALFLAADLVRARLEDMDQGKIMEMIGPILKDHPFPTIEMPKFMKPPKKYSRPKE